MKTAISIPDNIFGAAEKISKRFNISRSELYSAAVAEYIQKHRNDAVTEKLNEIYQKENGSFDPVVSAMQLDSLPKEEW